MPRILGLRYIDRAQPQFRTLEFMVLPVALLLLPVATGFHAVRPRTQDPLRAVREVTGRPVHLPSSGRTSFATGISLTSRTEAGRVSAGR